MNLSKKICGSLLVLAASIGTLAVPQPAVANGSCNLFCNDYGWLWGAVLGAAAGAAAGYAGSHNHGSRGRVGREGPIGPVGPEGPTGPMGEFPMNDTDALMITGTNLVVEATGVVYTFWIQDPLGNPLYTQSNVDDTTVLTNPIIDIPAATPKPEGTYNIFIKIQDPGVDPTTLANFMLNGVTMLPVDLSRDPTMEEAWVDGEVIVLGLPFPT